MNWLLFYLFVCDMRFDHLSFMKYFLHNSFVISLCFFVCCIRELFLNSLLLEFVPFIKSLTIFFKSCSLKIVKIFIRNQSSVLKNILGCCWGMSVNLRILINIIWYLNMGIVIEIIIYLLLCKEALKGDRISIYDEIRIDSANFFKLL